MSEDVAEHLNVNIEGVTYLAPVRGNFEWVEPGVGLSSVLYIDPIGDYNSKLLLDFSISYLSLNASAYLWVEDEWVYSLNDLKKISTKKFDPEWYFCPPCNRSQKLGQKGQNY